MSDQQPPSYPIGLRNDLLTAEHRRKLGNRIWELAWLVDRVTVEYQTEAGEVRGKVLGGAPIKAEQLAETFEMSKDAVLDSLDRLELAGYITRKRTGRGYLIEVRNSCKWPHRLLNPNASLPSNEGLLTDDESENRRVGDSANSPILGTDYPQADATYQHNPQGRPPPEGVPRVGESEDRPTRQPTDSPIPKDVAMETDIASGNGSTLLLDDESARAPEDAAVAAMLETERVWKSVLTKQIGNRLGDALLACEARYGPNFVDLTAPTDPEVAAVLRDVPSLETRLGQFLSMEARRKVWVEIEFPSGSKNTARGP